ncbi:indole-3-glycerol-phosphate synthase [Candidatus Parcubacteria bacterium]|nr:indole-3-glycerol-phosphate synthase [Candidatus Parcubacteria bacterium]
MKFNINTISDEKIKEIEKIKNKRSIISTIQKTKQKGLNPIIAEIKRKSPSIGIIKDIDIVEAAKQMEKGGASGISVLTDKHFSGRLDDLKKAKQAVKIPVLCKDFFVDEFQIYQAYACGADIVLLIARILKEKTKRFVEKVHELGMEALVEIHNEEDLKFALNSNAKLIGINNRDLKTLKIDLAVTERLASKIPQDRIKISESGIRSRTDLDRMFNLGIDAALIGTEIMLSDNIEKKVKELVY